MQTGISVLLTTHKRLKNLPGQLEAVHSQTIAPERVVVWHDGPLAPPKAGVPVVASTHNLGVWPRFLFCMEFDTEYVCVFDDDTIPGPRWFENCLATLKKCKGLVGASGFVFPEETREQRQICGWTTRDEEIRRVDVIGHCWFFRRDWLRYYALEPRPLGIKTAGEDYHFGVALQKHLRLGCYTAPHPVRDSSIWGSLRGKRLGADRHALYRTEGEEEKKNAVHDFYRSAGWKLLCELGDWETLSRPERHAQAGTDALRRAG